MAEPHVLFISGREAGYIRNRVLIAALGQHCQVSVLTPQAHSIPARTVGSLARLIARRPQYDVCVAGFYGQPLAIALDRLQRRPIILDAYVSTFDTLCQDRRWFRARSALGRLAWWLDHKSCQVSSRVLTDTHAHARYLVDTFGVPETKIEPVYVGCDENLFQAQEPALSEREQFEVFYYGSFLPLHGTDVIIRAAVALRQRPQIHFTLGGHGPQYADIKAMIQKLDLDNVQLLGWIPFERLPEHIARASICLGGHFSTVPKAARVVSTKTYQFVSMAKPTIVGDNAATRELFSHGDHVYAVRMGDAKALAEAVAILVDDPDLRQRIALGGRQVYKQRLSTAAIARQLATVVEQACTKGAP